MVSNAIQIRIKLMEYLPMTLKRLDIRNYWLI